MYKCGVWEFDIINNKIVIDGNPEQEIPDDELKIIARKMLDEWWDNRRKVSIGDTEYKMNNGDNERAVNRCLILEQDAYLVDAYDITVFVSINDLRSFALAIRDKRIEDLSVWDEKLAAIETGNPVMLPSVIESIAALT